MRYGPFALALLLLGAAEKVTPPNISPPDTWQARQTGTVRVLNKIDGRLATLTLKVGATAATQSLAVTLKACAVRPPDLPADSTAHLVIVDQREGAPPFDGWILAAEPAVNVYEHPVYDVHLVSCW